MRSFTVISFLLFSVGCSTFFRTSYSNPQKGTIGPFPEIYKFEEGGGIVAMQNSFNSARVEKPKELKWGVKYEVIAREVHKKLKTACPGEDTYLEITKVLAEEKVSVATCFNLKPLHKCSYEDLIETFMPNEVEVTMGQEKFEQMLKTKSSNCDIEIKACFINSDLKIAITPKILN